jgi:hypothetical protein
VNKINNFLTAGAREHADFPQFAYNSTIRNPSRLKEAIVRHCRRFDFLAEQVPTFEDDADDDDEADHVVDPESDVFDSDYPDTDGRDYDFF